MSDGPPPRRKAAEAFGGAADAYERGRPGYSEQAVTWLLRELAIEPGTVVADVAAGTGKLTAPLVAAGARVIAIEPSAGMLARLTAALPGVDARPGTAESLPLADGEADAITVAQAFHWFDGPRALAEFHRVSKPGARLGIVWNRRDMTDPLQAALGELMAPHRAGVPSHAGRAWEPALRATGLWRAIGEEEIPLVHELTREGVVDRIASVSFIAGLDDDTHGEVLQAVRALVADREEPVTMRHLTELYAFQRT